MPIHGPDCNGIGAESGNKVNVLNRFRGKIETKHPPKKKKKIFDHIFDEIAVIQMGSIIYVICFMICFPF